MSSGPGFWKLKPRSGESSCFEETPRSSKTPSTLGMLSWSKTGPRSRKFARTSLTLSASYPTKCCMQYPIAPPSWSNPMILAPFCKMAAACPPPPTVPSTIKRPGAGARAHKTSSTSTGRWYSQTPPGDLVGVVWRSLAFIALSIERITRADAWNVRRCGHRPPTGNESEPAPLLPGYPGGPRR